MIFSAGYFETRDLFFTGSFAHSSVSLVLNSFVLNVLPVLVESIVLPIFLFILAYKLNPNNPLRGQIQWALITGALYVFVFWLLESTIWISVIQAKGWGYLTSYPQNLLSYVLSVFGLLALAIYAAGFSAKSRRAETLQELNLKIVGVIILAFGLYFLWNYLTWIYFGGWSNWYAWFMGHNEDLWILSLPMLGLPLLFSDKPNEKNGSL
jgi:thiamine transporter ThiT